MRLVKCIRGKIRHSVEYPVCRFCVHAVSHRTRNAHHAVFLYAVNEVMPFLLHNVVLLFCHSPAHKVASAHRIACNVAHYPHHLLLIYHAAVCRLERRP